VGVCTQAPNLLILSVSLLTEHHALDSTTLCGAQYMVQLKTERTHTTMFKHTHVFVEMDELDSTYKRDQMTYKFGRVEEWKETHRWNLGLQEDLDQ
jgi:hypothetical protein